VANKRGAPKGNKNASKGKSWGEAVRKAVLARTDPNDRSSPRKLNKLRELGIEQIIVQRLVEINEQEVIVIGEDSKRRGLKADSVVVSWGATPNNSLEQQMKGQISKLYTIGDCKEPRSLLEAIHEGAYIARQI